MVLLIQHGESAWPRLLHGFLLLPHKVLSAVGLRGSGAEIPDACVSTAAVAQQPWAMWPAAARAPRRAADRMDLAAMPRSSKAVRKAVRHAPGDAQDCTMNDRT